MKKILSYFLLLVCVFSCETMEYATKTIDTNKPLENNFVFKSNNKKSISSIEILNRIKKEAGISSNEDLKNVSLTKLSSFNKTEKNSYKNLYVLKGESENGVSIAHIFSANLENTALMSEGRTCKCTSNSCSNGGCDASFFGESCRCSYCSSGECKKESTITDEYNY